MAIVDSKIKQLGLTEIIHEGIQMSDEENSKLTPAAVSASILAQLNMPNTVVRQTGNTLWIIHKGKNRTAFFQALNADTAQNLLANSREIVRWAYDDVGIDVMQTIFKENSFMNLFRLIAKNPVREGMGYQILKMKSGNTGVLLKLGPERE
jgi:hypothetical protein